MDPKDHLHERLLQMVAPLVMVPCGPQPTDVVRLGGIVRAGVDRTRVILLAGACAPASVAVEFRLIDNGGTELDVDAAVDWIRTLTYADLTTAVGERDSHGNVVVAADTLGFTGSHRATRYDINYFSILRQLLYGGGALWFENICTLHGYLLTGPDRHRLYVKNTNSGTVTGVDLPLTDNDGSIRPGQGGSFPVELPSLAEDDRWVDDAKLTTTDEYCSAVYDMSSWVNPEPAPDPDA